MPNAEDRRKQRSAYNLGYKVGLAGKPQNLWGINQKQRRAYITGWQDGHKERLKREARHAN